MVQLVRIPHAAVQIIGAPLFTRKTPTNNNSAQIILMVRSDPVEQIRNVLEQVAAARGLTQVHNEQSYGKTVTK